MYPKKAYAVDTGLANVVTLKLSDDMGKLAENIVFLQLKRQSYEKRQEIFYWKGKEREVDFAVKTGLKITDLIQVSWDVSDEKTRKREEEALLEAMDECGLSKGLIITKDTEAEKTLGGKTIKYVPLWKWMSGR